MAQVTRRLKATQGDTIGMGSPDMVFTGISVVHAGILHTGHTVTPESQGVEWPLVLSVVLGLATVGVVSWVAYNQFIA